MINLRVLKVLLSYHLNILENKLDDIYPMVEEIARIAVPENQSIAGDIMSLISWLSLYRLYLISTSRQEES